MAITTTRPADILEWASVDQLEPISQLPNKQEPTEELKLSGLLDNENLTRQHYNYLLDLISDWVNYFDTFHAVDSVFTTTDASETPATLNTKFGGTWVDIGELLTDAGDGAATQIYFFERTVL